MLPNDNQQELFFQLALSFVKDVGPITGRALLARFENAENIFKASSKELISVDGMGLSRISAIKDVEVFKKAEKEFEFCEKEKISIVTLKDAHYPKRFLNCEDAPLLFFYKGNANLNVSKVISIIGTRKNTDYGDRCCETLLADLNGTKDLLVISGLALGIDTLAHKYSLKNGLPTVGVLGHSLDTIYPSTNIHLAREMLEKGGALLSEFPSGTKPDKQNFPVRNRIVAGISDVTVVVESDRKGGAIITAYIAHSYGREIAAFPGRIFDSKSDGTNHLILKNIAALITNADELLDLMNWKERDTKKRSLQSKLFEDLLPEEIPLFEFLKQKDTIHIDELLMASGYSNSQLASILLQMEMKGLIKALPGKNYRLN